MGGVGTEIEMMRDEGERDRYLFFVFVRSDGGSRSVSGVSEAVILMVVGGGSSEVGIAMMTDPSQERVSIYKLNPINLEEYDCTAHPQYIFNSAMQYRFISLFLFILTLTYHQTKHRPTLVPSLSPPLNPYPTSHWPQPLQSTPPTHTPPQPQP